MDTFKAKTKLRIGESSYTIYALKALEKAGLLKLNRLPFSVRILLENLLRHEDGVAVRAQDIEALAGWDPGIRSDKEIAFMPARIVLQDFTGVPAMVDLAAMRDAIRERGLHPETINPLQPADLVIDHSVQVDEFGSARSFDHNVRREFKRNRERYEFLKWGQKAFKNFSVVPPGTGIIHQVNLEYLASVVFRRKDGREIFLYPDTLVGTDSHTTMINGLGVLGWGVGGIEAEAAMLGQSVSMLIPEVVGCKLSGRLADGVTATDLVLTLTQKLRQKGVVGKFVEFFGPGLAGMPLADRATVANMAPEYGATMGFFPVDTETLRYLRLTGRSRGHIACVEGYLKAQGLFREEGMPDPEFSDMLELDLGEVEACLAGPKRPQDRILLKDAKSDFHRMVRAATAAGPEAVKTFVAVRLGQKKFEIRPGSVVLASITSCTNTSNPAVMIAAGLLAKKAVQKGLHVPPWVKTSLSPGSRVVTDYLKRSKLLPYLEKLKFHLVGYGCMTCIGNSGPLPQVLVDAIEKNHLNVASVLSGNRNFEGRIHPNIRANYLASPPLVIAYALAGTVDFDFAREPLGKDPQGRSIFLKDIWPTPKEIQACLASVESELFRKAYARVNQGPKDWRALRVALGKTFDWDESSTYVKKPPYFQNLTEEPLPVEDLENGRVLALLGDSVTTDHISPAGNIPKHSPAGKYLMSQGVSPEDFNSYGARRGNHEVMVRGTFANVRLKNLLAPNHEGGMTCLLPEGKITTLYEAAVRYGERKVPLLIIAGKEYGTGSSRDWAAKGSALLGVKAVLAESYERIHRSNLIGMGILPLQFEKGQSRESLGLTGREVYAVEGIRKGLTFGARVTVKARSDSGEKVFPAIVRLDTPVELAYYRHGGILPYVVRSLSGISKSGPRSEPKRMNL